MEVKKLQEKTTNIFLSNLKRDNIKVSDKYLMLKLNEEIGELTRAYIIHEKLCSPWKYLPSKESKRKMAEELADVVGVAFALASALKIDVEEALVKKWITREWIKEIKGQKRVLKSDI